MSDEGRQAEREAALDAARGDISSSFAEAIGFRGYPAKLTQIQEARASIFDEKRATLIAAARAAGRGEAAEGIEAILDRVAEYLDNGSRPAISAAKSNIKRARALLSGERPPGDGPPTPPPPGKVWKGL